MHEDDLKKARAVLEAAGFANYHNYPPYEDFDRWLNNDHAVVITLNGDDGTFYALYRASKEPDGDLGTSANHVRQGALSALTAATVEDIVRRFDLTLVFPALRSVPRSAALVITAEAVLQEFVFDVMAVHGTQGQSIADVRDSVEQEWPDLAPTFLKALVALNGEHANAAKRLLGPAPEQSLPQEQPSPPVSLPLVKGATYRVKKEGSRLLQYVTLPSGGITNNRIELPAGAEVIFLGSREGLGSDPGYEQHFSYLGQDGRFWPTTTMGLAVSDEWLGPIEAAA
ncbi:hypothetical protein IC232_03240 [Microvirga sp. BT688]|uniref:hypothetical protein n=1 Tax=Microvirga sp. TaxID=1873136 RepID=UPI001689FB4D|nr:hypothetical protein [Microvirga sp.]MBD2745703.1 hypothetical protein [Microvirga sp.]